VVPVRLAPGSSLNISEPLLLIRKLGFTDANEVRAGAALVAFFRPFM
jgi:hypothetical protein